MRLLSRDSLRNVKENIRLENESTRQFNEQNRIDNFNQMQVVLNDKLNEVEEFKNDTNVIVKDFKNDINTEVEEQNTKINTHSSKLDNHEARIKTNEGYTRINAILIDALWNIGDGEVLKIHNEEGNVLSLIESKYGVLTVDELQGNTLVNYCKNGSEELTLNNEINVQGTNVTLTDTVDNSKVDVVCEGNTLVNLMEEEATIQGSTGTYYFWVSHDAKDNFNSKLKPLTTYTAIFYNSPVELKALYIGGIYSANKISSNVFKIILGNNIEDTYLHFYTSDTTLLPEYFNDMKVVLLEGDYTNKPIPSYFEGMKSVGECEDNKIEILSRNKNLFVEDLINETGSGNSTNGSLYPSMFKHNDTRCRTANLIKVKPNTTYYFSSNDKFHFAIAEFDKDNKQISENGWTIQPQGGIHTTSYNCASIVVVIKKTDNSKITPQEIYGNIQIEEGNSVSSYVSHSLNKKEISLNEPLRGLPNGVCDKFVKQGGKWYV